LQNIFGGWEFWRPGVNVYSEIQPNKMIILAPFKIENTGHFPINDVSCKWKPYIEGTAKNIKSISILNSTFNFPNTIPTLKPGESTLIARGGDPIERILGKTNFITPTDLPSIEIIVSYRYFFIFRSKSIYKFRAIKDVNGSLVWFPVSDSEKI
jgi:hypothetical protein